ncbi:isoprenylcysteine carboxylmethyltransferase family protein [Microbacterium sp. MM2322]|uniref:methyltransferase family protein n=1 Tax=Microbacterium sp. MM2322 TaxID=3157631 RepID=UPI0032D57A63
MAILDIPLFVVASAIAATGRRFAVFVVTIWTLLVTVMLALFAAVTSEAGWGAVLMAAASAASVLAGIVMLRGSVPTHWLMVGPFRIRPAAAGQPVRRHVGATALQIVVFWGVALGIVPAVIVWFETRWMLHVPAPAGARIAGAVLFAAASVVGLWSAAVMSTAGDGTPLPIATARRLVIRGPYRFVRNPMALAGISQGVAVGLMLSSWLVVVYAVCGSVVWDTAIRPHEERDLEDRFGAEFRRYRAQVRCWMPRLTPAALDQSAASPAGASAE